MDMQSWLVADYYLSNLIKQIVTLAFTNVKSSIFSMPYLKYFHQFFPWVLLPLGLVILKWHLGSIIISWNLTLYLTCLWILVGTNNLNFFFILCRRNLWPWRFSWKWYHPVCKNWREKRTHYTGYPFLFLI